jgi:hypothetical protein
MVIDRPRGRQTKRLCVNCRVFRLETRIISTGVGHKIHLCIVAGDNRLDHELMRSSLDRSYVLERGRF